LPEDYFSFTGRLFDRANIAEKPEALKGIRVLDLSRVIYGPMVTKWLSLFGAEVIKVEEPSEGDDWRTGTYWAKYWKDSCPYFQSLNPNKYFTAIDLKTDKGKALVLNLAKTADVVVENFRAGLVEAWGLGYTEVSRINPKVIYISCSGFGQWGPLRFFPSYDLIAQSMAGVAQQTGFPEGETYKLPDYYGDFFPGLLGAAGVLAAVYHQRRTGKGQYIDMAQTEGLMRAMHHWTYLGHTGEELGRTGNHDPALAPSGIFKTREGRFIAIAIATDEQFERLLQAMGREDLRDDPRFADTFQRLRAEHAEALNKVTGEWAESASEEEIMALAAELGFPAAPVMDDRRLVEDEWRRERGSLMEFDDEMYGIGRWAGPAASLEKSPGRLKWLTRPVGYHNRYIFKKLLGLSDKEIQELIDEHVIGFWDHRVGQRPPSYWDLENDDLFHYQKDEEA